MSKTVTPKYRLVWTEVDSTGLVERQQVVWSKEYGTANKQNALRYVRAYESSTREGGANAHIGARTVVRFSVVNQITEQTVCSQSIGQIE